MARFRVYNPSPSTVSALSANEFTQLTFSAGYQDNQGVVFSGNYKQHIYGHETAVDTYVDIFAADSDKAYNSTRVTKTLAAGWKPQDRFQAAVDAFGQAGVTLGSNTLDLSKPAYPRGIPLIGMARNHIREVVMSAGGLWSIQQGKIMVTPKTLDSSSGTVSLTASTGLIGWPKQTDIGIEVTSLINPALQPLTKIMLDPSQIIAAEQNNNPFTSGDQTNTNLANQQLGAGTYTIFKMNRVGDTRGEEWFDESVCIGLGGILPPSQGSQGYALGPS